MGHFDRKYTPDQHAAVQNAKINEGLTYARIDELAKAGKLYGLAPFEMTRTTMEKTVASERKRRRIADYHPEAIDPHTAALDIHKWLQSQVCTARDEINQQMQNGKLKGEAKLAALRDLAKTQMEIDRLRVKPTKPTKEDPEKATEKRQRKASPTLEAITKSANRKRPALPNVQGLREEDGERAPVTAEGAGVTTEDSDGEASGRVPSPALASDLAGAVPLEQPDPAPTVAETVA